jgi:hypothetical protein
VTRDQMEKATLHATWVTTLLDGFLVALIGYMQGRGVYSMTTVSMARDILYTVLDERLEVPFETEVLGVKVTVERVELSDAEEIVAICRRGRGRQAIPILELPLPVPRPEGSEWIEAYRRWTGRR